MKLYKGFWVGILFLALSSHTTLFGQEQEKEQSFWENLNIHGFLSQGYMLSSDNNYLGRTSEGSFEFNEFGLNFSTNITDNLRIGAQLLSRDLGNDGNNQIFVDWAFADFSIEDWLGIRAGKIKMPLGLYNEYRDLDMARKNIFLPQGSYIESWRESFTALTGAGLYGSIDGSSYSLGELSYQIQAGVITIDDKSGLDKTIEDELNANLTEYDITPSYIASAVWESPLDGLKLGASFWNTEEIKGKGRTPDIDVWRNRTIGAAQGVAQYANANFGTNFPLPTTYDEALAIFAGTGIDMNLVDVPMIQKIKDVKATWYSAEYTWEDLTAAYEVFRMNTQLKTTSPGYGADLGDPTLEVLSDFKTTLGGYHFTLGYQLNDQISASAYHSEFYTDIEDTDYIPGRLIDSAFSLRYNYDSHWTFKTELHKMNGTAVMYDEDQADPNNLKTNWYLFAAKATFNF